MRPQQLPHPWKGLLVAVLGFLTVWALWPLIWLGLSFPRLSGQEPDTPALFAAAPRVFLTGAVVKVSGPAGAVPGRYLLRSQERLDDHLAAQGWTFTDQMGAGRFYQQPGHRLTATCRLYTRHFSVCQVSAPE
ncbi:hypothetical protein Dcar01_01717 [Deinococcus carri]|uniref:Uncharacterized protein n=1 Tax=Deinococcus carri TaxID=1211323 RepID=A0ABP9WAE8_9DEIO